MLGDGGHLCQRLCLYSFTMDGSRLSVTKLLWPAATGVKSVVDGEEHNVAERERKRESERTEKERVKGRRKRDKK